MNKINSLIDLYKKSSKHSNYQLLYPTIEKIINVSDLKILSRYEKARLDYIISKLDFNNKCFVDIGGNTGYFTFSALDNNANTVDYYEGNHAHAEFVKLASKIINCQKRLIIYNKYIDLEFTSLNKPADVIFLLNVLHHIGDDYGGEKDKNEVLLHIANVLKNLANQTQYLVLQIGFNWRGDRNYPIFPNGIKSEMIDFVRDISTEDWEMKHVGVAEVKKGDIAYYDVTKSNIHRDDSLGEFLNRPLFILKSKKIFDKKTNML